MFSWFKKRRYTDFKSGKYTHVWRRGSCPAMFSGLPAILEGTEYWPWGPPRSSVAPRELPLGSCLATEQLLPGYTQPVTSPSFCVFASNMGVQITAYKVNVNIKLKIHVNWHKTKSSKILWLHIRTLSRWQITQRSTFSTQCHRRASVDVSGPLQVWTSVLKVLNRSDNSGGEPWRRCSPDLKELVRGWKSSSKQRAARRGDFEVGN